jgi:acyl-CoA thioester hydrolase
MPGRVWIIIRPLPTGGPGLNLFKDKYPFFIEDNVEWGDMDAFQHVNNTMYFRYFERVRFAYFDKLGVTAEMESSGIGPILASTQCRFRSALTYPDEILIGSGITGLQADRFLMKYGIYSKKDQCVAAEGDGFIIYFDYNKNLKADIPARLFDILQNSTGR